YKADKMMVVTNSYFTSAAYKLAAANDVTLWDRNSINQFFKIKKG
ncbi:MAG: restriction endonuclease, partial [Lachnospiraceae bacterium]